MNSILSWKVGPQYLALKPQDNSGKKRYQSTKWIAYVSNIWPELEGMFKHWLQACVMMSQKIQIL